MSIIAVNDLTKHSSSVEHMIAIIHNGIPVITTELLAGVYETDVIRIQQNHTRNADRFVEGKHFFKLTGSILKEFKNRLSLSESVEELPLLVGKRARSLILWTQRGAARHAKMLDTDKAWDVFEKLEDFYFNQKEAVEALKTTVLQRNPLKDAVNLLVSKKRIMYPEAYSLIHQRFNVESIDELTIEQLPQAVEYVHKMVLEGEFLGKEELPKPEMCIDLSSELRNINALHNNLKQLKEVWDRLNPHLFALAPDMAHAFTGAFSNVSGPALALKHGLERKTHLLN